MKHLFSLSLLLLALLLPATASAHYLYVDGIYYYINGNEATVTSSPYDGLYIGEVTIPATVTYNGTIYSVTEIGDGAFSGCSDLTSVTIPNSVTSIGQSAFWCCTSLTSIDIPNSVTTIGDYAFDYCTNLTNITIGNSVTSIGDYAFFNCSGLTSITIPNSVITIGQYAFSGCSSLTSITIPNSVITIGQYAFSGCSSLTSIDIPCSVTTIGDRAFLSCSGLTSIDIPNSVTSIGNRAFEYCSKLTSVTVANGNTTYDSRNNCNAIIETASNTLIFGCMNTIIPNSVTSIGSSAFQGCSGLTSIDIPNSVISIGDYAFSNCTGLTNLTIGNSVISIGNSAFYCCWNLTEFYCFALTPPTIYYNTFNSSNSSYGASLYVPYNALENYKAAVYWKEFANIDCITFEIDGKYYRVLDESTLSVMANSDEATLYSGDVVIPDSVTYAGQTFAVTCIESNAFDGCFELTSVVIPNSVETIGEQAFQGCTGLTSVTIGSGVTTIGAKAFNYCNALETVKCIGTVPPVMANTDCFSTAAYNRTTLIVPRNYEATYAAADYWYKFAHIDGWGSAGRGDIDGDGRVSISDVTALIDAILSGDYEGVYFESADLNINGRLDIGDVTTLIDMLLNDN